MKKQKILFASSDYRELCRWMKEKEVRKILLVCGRSFDFFAVNKYLYQFAKNEKATIVRFEDFCPNPDYESVVKGVELFRRQHCDCIIAAGGGSAMDVAKCIKLFSTMDHGIPFLVLPATAGTGSESTRYAVIYIEGRKHSVTDDSMIPEMVLLDEGMLETLPLYQKKSALLDALCHAVESFWSLNSTRQSREYSRKAIELIMKNMDGYFENDAHASRNMLIAANLSGKAINIAQTTAGHAMCYKITSLFGTAHGHAAALCNRKLFLWMVQNPEKCTDPRGEKYLKDIFWKIGQAMGCRSAQAAAEKLEAVFVKLELEVPQANEEQFEILRNSVNQVRLKNHPVALDNQTIDMLYHEILRKTM